MTLEKQVTSDDELTRKNTTATYHKFAPPYCACTRRCLIFERNAYERARDKIANSYAFLQLVMSDPWFCLAPAAIRTHCRDG